MKNNNRKRYAFEFDLWMELAQKDPQAFEKKRKEVIQSAISKAPMEMQPRLNGLQWCIDAKIKASKNPMDGCLKIYQMMMDSIYAPDGLLNALKMENLEATPEKDIQSTVVSNVYEIK